MDFDANTVLERVAFGTKCVLHRVRVSQCFPSRVIQNLTKQPPPSRVNAPRTGMYNPFAFLNPVLV